MVRSAKEYIAAGDIFQVVLSQRFSRTLKAEPFQVYRALRRLNPSPYMFYFEFGDVDIEGGSPEPLALVGASPEMMTRLEMTDAGLESMVKVMTVAVSGRATSSLVGRPDSGQVSTPSRSGFFRTWPWRLIQPRWRAGLPTMSA